MRSWPTVNDFCIDETTVVIKQQKKESISNVDIGVNILFSNIFLSSISMLSRKKTEVGPIFLTDQKKQHAVILSLMGSGLYLIFICV